MHPTDDGVALLMKDGLPMAGDQMVSLSLEENVANLIVCCEMVKTMKVLTKQNPGILVVCRICPTEDGVAVMMKDGARQKVWSRNDGRYPDVNVVIGVVIGRKGVNSRSCVTVG